MSFFNRPTPPPPPPGPGGEPPRPSAWAWAHMAEDEKVDYEQRQAAWLRDTSDPRFWGTLCDMRTLFLVYWEECGDPDPTWRR